MSEFLDAVVARVLQLEVNLLAGRERMAAHTDPEALHDVRIAIRKLRSLLRPFRKLIEHDPLVNAAAELGRISSAVRDNEVLLGELRRHGGLDALATRWQQALPTQYESLLHSAEALRLQRALDLWPSFFRQSLHDAAPEHLKAYVTRQLAKESKRLSEAMADPAHDRHRLRILIKRVRYCADTYPQLVNLAPKHLNALRRAQNALGAWHDRLQWLARAEQELELAPLVAQWRKELAQAEQRSDVALEKLGRVFSF
ncbi:CHAD domain-containing protein [Pseudomonas turukhanskensis]|uniref:CHAD domain-containing protein n=1 Tax=Pseudomonas turukhanskensis TaxID=1806536 RepID=A0A9W6NGD8_9PSED|nr:CHAD domain-containing protein [Pseudomonas turukhanskensis]GLK89725.1 CHAD domain-containing protein [Pseudomonas turukhanskensis]